VYSSTKRCSPFLSPSLVTGHVCPKVGVVLLSLASKQAARLGELQSQPCRASIRNNQRISLGRQAAARPPGHSKDLLAWLTLDYVRYACWPPRRKSLRRQCCNNRQPKPGSLAQPAAHILHPAFTAASLLEFLCTLSTVDAQHAARGKCSTESTDHVGEANSTA
jgi:hypothetical protein